jgi:glyceraldehyde-3-phosphate dehydrogenase/erythrose-4-phosphate dehydrogenase
VVTWFDNEWGYANRMVDVAVAWSQMRAGGMSDV